MATRSRVTPRQSHGFIRSKATSEKAHQHKSLVEANGAKRLVWKYHKSEPPRKKIANNGHNPQVKDPAFNTPKTLVANENNRLNGEVTAVPNPFPDTGLPPPRISAPLVTPVPSSVPAHSVILSKSVPQSTASVSHLLLSLGPIVTPKPIYSALTITSSYSVLDPPDNTANTSQSHQTSQFHKLSKLAVILLVLGSGLIVAGIFIAIKCYSRPTRRTRLKPSRPILDDPFSDDKTLQAAESPMFGGKERISSQLGGNNVWSWTQYSQPGTIVPNPTIKRHNDASGRNSFAYNSISPFPQTQGRVSYATHDEGIQYPFTSHTRTQSAPIQAPRSIYHPSIQQIQGGLSHVNNRISTTSMSVYPASPQNSDVGIAIGSASPSTTTCNHRVHKQSNDGTTAKQGQYNIECKDASSATPENVRFSQGLVYDDSSDTPLPIFLPYVTPQTTPAMSRGGRTRIKSSYYTSGSYPRPSHFAGKPEVFASQYQPSAQKSGPRKNQDTQALTYALGLSSDAGYIAHSPQPTLYPDDSLSVVDDRRSRKQKQKYKKETLSKDNRTSFPVITTAMDANAAVGSLMLLDSSPPVRHQDFGRLSTNDITGLMNSTATITASLSTKTSSTSPKKDDLWSSDKPPYIPLPPPLPSLTQMGLEHANPQAYADYRSPTYSIFGLYENERKSGFGSG